MPIKVDLRASLDQLTKDLTSAIANNLAGLILHGAAARDDARGRPADVGLVVVLKRADGDVLAAVAPPLKAAWRAIGAEAMIATEAEIRAAADVFPARFLAIQTEHVVLSGSSPFATLEISHANLRLRVEQELRNLVMRIRRRIVDASSDDVALVTSMRAMTPPAALALWGLLELLEQRPANTAPPTVFAAAAEHCDLDGDTLSALARVWSDGSRPDDLLALANNTIATLGRAAELADRWEPPS